MTKIKLLLAIVAIIITVAAGSVAQALAIPVTANVQIINVESATACSLDRLILTPLAGGTANDSINCEIIVTATNEPWSMTMNEYAADVPAGHIVQDYEPDLAHSFGVAGHPDVIADCDDTEINTGITGFNCDLTDAAAETIAGTQSEFGIWLTDGPTGNDTITFIDCDAQNNACPLAETSRSIILDHPATTTVEEGILLHAYAFVNDEVTASHNYFDGIVLLFF